MWNMYGVFFSHVFLLVRIVINHGKSGYGDMADLDVAKTRDLLWVIVGARPEPYT